MSNCAEQSDRSGCCSWRQMWACLDRATAWLLHEEAQRLLISSSMVWTPFWKVRNRSLNNLHLRRALNSLPQPVCQPLRIQMQKVVSLVETACALYLREREDRFLMRVHCFASLARGMQIRIGWHTLFQVFSDRMKHTSPVGPGSS